MSASKKEKKVPALVDKPMDFCPGCGHGIISRLIMECLDELNQNDNIIFPIGVGCSSNLGAGLECDRLHCSHGRAGAVATGMKRVNPDVLIVSYQGDGDAYNIGIAETFNEALYKAFIGAGIRLPKHKQMIITVKDEDKKDIIPIAKRFEAQGYRIFATRGTASILTENGIKVTRTNKLEQPSPNLMDLILGHKIDVVIDTPPQGVEHQKDGFVIRRNAIETGVNVLTSLDTAEALVTSLENTDLNHLTLVDIATIDNR